MELIQNYERTVSKVSFALGTESPGRRGSYLTIISPDDEADLDVPPSPTEKLPPVELETSQLEVHLALSYNFTSEATRLGPVYLSPEALLTTVTLTQRSKAIKGP